MIPRIRRLGLSLALAAFAAGAALPAHAADIETAVTAGDLALVEQLIAQGADVNQKGAMLGMRPLHWATVSGNKAMVELLLAKGADVNIQKNDGYTPLHLAAARGNLALIEVLLAKGASPALKNNAGATPADVAKDDATRKALAGGKG